MTLQARQITVPHVGEGIHHVTVTKILKKPGDWVDEDENIMEIETDKTLLEIPSPVSGLIGEVLCSQGERIAVGEKLLTIQPGKQGATQPVSLAHYQKRKRDMVQAPKLELCVDSKRYIGLPDSQIELIHQMRRSESLVIPAAIEMAINWEIIDSLKSAFRMKVGSFVPSSHELILWGVSQAMFSFPKFRSRLADDLKLEVSEEARIGTAIAANEDQILTPVILVRPEHQLENVVRESRHAVRQDVQKTRTPYHSLVISDMSSMGVIRANPVVIYPAMATLFVGAPYYVMTEKGKRKTGNVVLSFDHRAINGAYAAKFIKKIEENLLGLDQTMGD